MTGYWSFENLGEYQGFTNTLTDLQSTGVYYHGIIDTVGPTIDFMYHQVLLNPIFIGLLLVLLVLSLFTFGE